MAETVVVGGGIAGVACARVLRDAGRSVLLLDRGHRLGGRLGLRHHDGRPTDIGAAYFTSSDADFATQVEDWADRGLVRPWTDTFDVRSADGHRRSTGPMRWAAPAGLRGLVDDVATGVPVERATVAAVTRTAAGWTVDSRAADAVVLAMPDPQARRLLEPAEAGPLDADFEPVLVLTVIWPEPTWDRFDASFVNDDEVLALVVDDGRRRFDDAPVLVAHSTSSFAAQHLADPEVAVGPMLDRLVDLLGISGEPTLTSVQRWSFARPARPHGQPYLLTSDGLGACGDAWSDKPRVEAAYLSGKRLGQALLGR